jgi:hypothetical protein
MHDLSCRLSASLGNADKGEHSQEPAHAGRGLAVSILATGVLRIKKGVQQIKRSLLLRAHEYRWSECIEKLD